MTRAVLDAGRRTLTLPRRLVPTVMLLGTGAAGVDRASVRDLVELERAGIAPGRRLHPLAAEMLEVVTGPRRVITVTAGLPDSQEISTIWIRSRTAVLGRPSGPDLFQLGPIELGLLPFHLAQLVELRPRPEAPFTGSVTIPVDVLDDLADTWLADPNRAADELALQGVERTWADRLAIAHRHLHSRWRLASLWVGADGNAGDDELIVLDAGPAGHWQVLPDADTVGQVTFATRRFVDVLELLHEVGRVD